MFTPHPAVVLIHRGGRFTVRRFESACMVDEADGDSYALERGRAGAERLKRLGQTMAATTDALFQRAGLRAGMRCLDVGCGVGVVSRRLAELTGSCLGVDVDRRFIEIATAEHSMEGLSFRHADAHELPGEETYDVLYIRYLLSHLGEPDKVLAGAVSKLAPGGWLLIEDIDFPAHVHHPPCPAFQRYLNLYQEVVRLRGGDACIGRRLLGLATSLDLECVSIELVVALHHTGPGKQIAELTLEQISGPLLEASLVEEAELKSLLGQLKKFREDPTSFMSIAPTYQLIARKVC